MPGRILILFILSYLLVSGCASHNPLLLPSDRPKSDAGYIYGRLSLEATPQACGLGVGLILSGLANGKEEEYLLKFIKLDHDFEVSEETAGTSRDDIIGMSLHPGDYTIENAAFLSEDGSEFTRKSFNKHFGTFTVEKGKAYYLGDFTAVTKCTRKSAQGNQYSWSMKEADINFIKTTADFNDKFIHFKECEKKPLSGM